MGRRRRNIYRELSALNERRDKLVKKILEEAFPKPDPRFVTAIRNIVRMENEDLSLEQLANILADTDMAMVFAIAETPPDKQAAMIAAYQDPEFWDLLEQTKARLQRKVA
jgi:hypothetical protein